MQEVLRSCVGAFWDMQTKSFPTRGLAANLRVQPSCAEGSLLVSRLQCKLYKESRTGFFVTRCSDCTHLPL